MAVDFDREAPIGYITLNRPPANSYDYNFMDELGRAVAAAADDPEVKVVVVRSALDRFFSAGADVKAFSENTPERNMDMIRLAHQVLGRIARIPKVFIAQIAGHAVGGGLEIALACDLRFGADGEYRLGLPEVTLGLLPGNGGTQRLPRLIGWSKALDMMVTGRTVTPQEALQLGILDRVFPADKLAEETRAYAEALARGALKAIGHIKLAVHQGLDGGLDYGLRVERELIEDLFRSQDSQEGIRAFLERRQPQFKGL
ncbi:putative enoyl-CoA hydratase echA8 [bacterium HR24]|jgi:enoyl-CoA hydratase/carnithine racemase|nr:putative enoyl-CoA hydratase echA8 [bacterium HR24]